MRLVLMMFLALVVNGCAVISVDPPKLKNAGIPSEFNVSGTTVYIDYNYAGVDEANGLVRNGRAAELQALLTELGFKSSSRDTAEYVIAVNEKGYDDPTSVLLLFTNVFSAQIIPALWDTGSSLTYEVKKSDITLSKVITTANVKKISGLVALLAIPLNANDNLSIKSRIQAHESVLADLIDQGVFE